jgi:hypothetical protein
MREAYGLYLYIGVKGSWPPSLRSLKKAVIFIAVQNRIASAPTMEKQGAFFSRLT